MRVVIDARGKVRPEIGRVSGVAQYVSHITEALVALSPDTFVALDEESSGLPLVGRHLGFARRADALRAHLFFSPSGLLPLGLKTPAIAFIHDLFILDHPEWFPDTALQRTFTLKVVLPQTVRRALQLIVPSEGVRQDLLRWFPAAEGKITVIAEGVAPPSIIKPLTPKLRKRFGISDRFVLSVATIDPRKNLLATVHGFARMQQQIGWDGQLVIVGTGGWKNALIRAEMDKTPGIVWLSNVTEEEKWSLYAAADLCLQTSLAEGFGLPPFEAMAAGTPVATTMVGALPELATSAVLALPTNQIQTIADRVGELLLHPHRRAEMAAEGRRIVQGLTWRAAAQKTLEVFTRF